MLGKEGTPLSRRYFNPETGEELSDDDIVRGYPLGEDRYVPVTDDELEGVAPEKTRDIDLVRFVPLEQLDPASFQRAYYLAPGGNTTKAYRLLAATMEKTGKAGIATFVMRGVEYLVAIVAEGGILRAETLRFPDELRSPEDVGLPNPGKPPAREVKRIAAAIGRLSKGKLDERELEDVWSQGLSALAEKKKRKGTDVVEAPEGEARVDEDARVIDLLEVLKRSMQAAGPAGNARKAAKKTASKTAKKTARKSRAKEAG
jgi:DNA end-binding protein Ku